MWADLTSIGQACAMIGIILMVRLDDLPSVKYRRGGKGSFDRLSPRDSEPSAPFSRKLGDYFEREDRIAATAFVAHSWRMRNQLFGDGWGF